MSRKAVEASFAVAIGPYSHAVWSGKRLYLSGQTPVDPATGQLAEGGIGPQTEQCFKNLFSVLAAAGLGPKNVIKANVYMTNLDDFAGMNAVYQTMFEMPYPAAHDNRCGGLAKGGPDRNRTGRIWEGQTKEIRGRRIAGLGRVRRHKDLRANPTSKVLLTAATMRCQGSEARSDPLASGGRNAISKALRWRARI